jgi:hypothetical protein
VTLDGGGDLLQHGGIGGKVRRGLVIVEEVAHMELTKVGERRWRRLQFHMKPAVLR